MEKSTHKVEVVQVKLEKHPDADKLSVVKVFDYQVCVNTADWQDGALAAYIPPDSIVDTTRPEFAFLGEHKHIKAKKLRGIISLGLMVPAPEGSKLGDDVAELLGVTHYEEPITFDSNGDNESGPPGGYYPEYDIDSMLRYASVFKPGEPVWVTEKIHGANSRFCYREGRMWVGSHTNWKKKSEGNQWWAGLKQHPEIVEWCQEHQDCTLYAELYGNVQWLTYGVNGVKIAVFDILRGTEWINPGDAVALGPQLPWVPLISDGVPFNLDWLKSMANGSSLVHGASNIREGIVVKPMIGRFDPTIGRVILKIVGSEYLLKSKQKKK